MHEAPKDYDAAADGIGSYYAAIDDKRRRGSMGCWEKPAADPGRWRFIALLACMILSCVAAGFLICLISAPARAHEAMPTAAKPQGWSYSFSCCSGYDCREVEPAAISERPDGYVINGTGEVVGYQDARLKDSPDGAFHWCSVAGAADGKTICLYVPPRSW